MASLIDIAREASRQSLTRDDRFYKTFIYFFELKAPSEALGSESLIFPLMLNPQSISVDEPFTVEATPTQGGGIYVEENGIVQRMIRISGHTGWMPRNLPYSGFVRTLKPKNKGHSRSDASLFSITRAGAPTAIGGLSGQKHFQLLQDAIFRLYADLKKDPEFAEETKLFFHNPKDQEAWRVIPQRFSMSRDASKPLHYPYTIEMIAVDSVTNEDRDFSEDKNIFDLIKEPARIANTVTGMVNAGIQDLINIREELIDISSSYMGALDNATSIVRATTDFLEGNERLIDIPYAQFKANSDEWAAAVDEFEAADKDPGPEILNTIHQMWWGILLGGMGLEAKTRKTVQDLLGESRDAEELSTNNSRQALTAASEVAPPATVDKYRRKGTGLNTGDLTRADAEFGVGRDLDQYSSNRTYTIQRGDTVHSISAKFLGDARNWRHIVTLNALKFPYIAENPGQRGVVTIGDTILIPTTGTPREEEALIPVVGVPPDAEAEERLLGADLEVEPLNNGTQKYDFAIDVEGGATDFKLVKGKDNLSQLIRTRLITEKGTNVMYQSLGTDRVVGTNIPGVDRELVVMRMVKAIQADPRIASVNSVQFTTDETSDLLEIEIEAAIKGFGSNELIQTYVGT